MESRSSNVVIYTDGGCAGNPGPGGWGAVIIADGKKKELSGGERATTNNRMELMAAISALRAVKESEVLCARKIIVNIDSQYVKNGITVWIKSWKAADWKTSRKSPVKNQDLWQMLDELNSSLNVEWNWVKGHAGIKYNEICDNLCKMEMAYFFKR